MKLSVYQEPEKCLKFKCVEAIGTSPHVCFCWECKLLPTLHGAIWWSEIKVKYGDSLWMSNLTFMCVPWRN